MPKKKKLPPCPDPENYILVESKEGQYWRRKRGTLTPARLNAAWERSRKNTSIASPAAKGILKKIASFTKDFDNGRKADV